MNHMPDTPWWVLLGFSSRSDAFGLNDDEDPYQELIREALETTRYGDGERLLRAMVRELNRG